MGVLCSLLPEMFAAGVLKQLGFVDLDLGRCFKEGMLQTFANCCSVGDFEEQCWGASSDLSSRDKERCCGGAARRTVSPQLVASVAAQLGSASPKKPPADVLVPAVDSWLKDPTGKLASGETHSMALVNLLAEDVTAEDVLHQQGEQLKAPAEKLTRDLEAMKGPAGVIGRSSRETWIPVPTLTASGGRRALYTTIALSPQLLPLEPDEAAAAEANARLRTPGTWEEVRLDDTSQSALQKVLAKEAAHFAKHKASPTLRALHEAASLLKELDHRSEELEASKGPASPSASEHVAECSAGWRELGAEEIRRLRPGSHLRLRERGGDDPTGREVKLEAQLRVTGEPGTQDRPCLLCQRPSHLGTMQDPGSFRCTCCECS